MPKVIACGSRADAYDSFCTAADQAGPSMFPVLLVDSEDPVAPGNGSWAHLKTRDGWERPAGVADEQAHLMVQCMEAWFLADRGTVARFFGRNFHANSLPARTDVENVAKSQLFTALSNATRHCDPKGEYDKGEHSFDLLALIDPQLVQNASDHANKLVEKLKERA
jgi:hypothetical protein